VVRSRGGAIGHAEDTLFWLQVRAAGFRILAAYTVLAEHNPDPSRTGRRAMAQLAEKRGEFDAYLDYHWNHTERRYFYLAFSRAAAKLWWTRIRRLPQWIFADRLPTWEMEPLEQYHFRRRLLVERKRPSNYDAHGFIKRAGTMPDELASIHTLAASDGSIEINQK
jgi:hypothetical protein